ncbi:MAG: hypothetical protein WEB58_11695 [Planctomycetaceae bacterium]
MGLSLSFSLWEKAGVKVLLKRDEGGRMKDESENAITFSLTHPSSFIIHPSIQGTLIRPAATFSQGEKDLETLRYGNPSRRG